MQVPMKKIENPDQKHFYWRCETCGYQTEDKKNTEKMLMNSRHVARDAEIKGHAEPKTASAPHRIRPQLPETRRLFSTDVSARFGRIKVLRRPSRSPNQSSRCRCTSAESSSHCPKDATSER